MNRFNTKTIVLACGAVLLSSLTGQTAKADLIQTVLTGSAVMADSQGTSTGAEALTVNYSVTKDVNTSVYTYNYTVFNPPGDIVLPSGPTEEFDVFSVGFSTTLPGALVGGSLNGGVYNSSTAGGVTWYMYPAIYAGSNSGVLSFASDLPPVPGTATAQDSNPPSPWSTYPFGSPVPVPGVPDSANTMALLGGVMLLLLFRSILRKQAALAR
jgi:hypothetical protein